MDVAPFTGAWIEITLVDVLKKLGEMVAPFTGAWIEILICPITYAISCSRTLHGCVDWNDDKNEVYLEDVSVAPFTGAWIEIRLRSSRLALSTAVAPFTGAWIEIHTSHRLL